jgi:prepilin-type N-terminal cleavage/methylation domain-containing protein
MSRASPKHHSRGTTLIEVMIAMVVLAIGLIGLLAANVTASQQNSAASRQNRGTAIARDLLSTVSRWDFNDGRLADIPGNNAATFTSGRSFTRLSAANFELDVNTSAARTGTFDPAPASSVDINGDGLADYDRYLAVVPFTNGIRVIATVQWREAGTWRRVSLFDVKYNPTLNRATVPGL